MARAERSVVEPPIGRAKRPGAPDDPGQAITGYRGARRRLVARVAVSGVGAWASGLMLALLATSALVAGAFGLAAG